MDDIIYRQDAIDGVKSYINLVSDYAEDPLVRAVLIGVKGMLACMPSAQPGWIPCDERLPEVNEDVLVFSRNGDIRISTFSKINETPFWWNDAYGYWDSLDSVIAWMLMPKPYKEAENG